MHLKTAIAAGLAFIITAIPTARAQTATGNEMLRACTDFGNQRSNSPFYAGVCSGVLQAVFDMNSGILFCPPPGVTIGQAALVVVADMQRHPETMHLPLPVLADMAFASAWPCPKRPVAAPMTIEPWSPQPLSGGR